VRLQWSREDDFGWSMQQAPYFGSMAVGLDDDGRMTTFIAEHCTPCTNYFPMLGELLAGKAPDMSAIDPIHMNHLFMEWPYDRVPHHIERGHGGPDFGADSPLGWGLRHRSMRSPGHLQQNFGVECMVTEAAAAAGADPLQFRIDHTTDERLIKVLETVRRMSGWETRPSPAPGARAKGGGIVHGRGLGVVVRHGGYFAGVVEITVDLDTGKIVAPRYWLAADAGVVVNPRLLRLNLEGGSVMGFSQALLEEAQFDASAITSVDYQTYPVLTMAELPEIEVEIIPRPDAMVVGQAAEPPNMVPPVAIAAAVHDATGVAIRRLPMRPEYVLAELRDS
jgi:CO/xanthine dehydrogenase Mo-binding subunit